MRSLKLLGANGSQNVIHAVDDTGPGEGYGVASPVRGIKSQTGISSLWQSELVDNLVVVALERQATGIRLVHSRTNPIKQLCKTGQRRTHRHLKVKRRRSCSRPEGNCGGNEHGDDESQTDFRFGTEELHTKGVRKPTERV